MKTELQVKTLSELGKLRDDRLLRQFEIKNNSVRKEYEEEYTDNFHNKTLEDLLNKITNQYEKFSRKLIDDGCVDAEIIDIHNKDNEDYDGSCLHIEHETSASETNQQIYARLRSQIIKYNNDKTCMNV